MKRILAIDPGSRCGWALSEAGTVVTALSGVWDLSTRRHEGAGMRMVHLERNLQQFQPWPELVVYEEVAAHKGVSAAHVYGAIVGIVQLWCETRSIPYCGVPVGTLKKHATGKGNSDKDAMVLACAKRFVIQPATLDHNRADALWLLDYALTEIAPARETPSRETPS